MTLYRNIISNVAKCYSLYDRLLMLYPKPMCQLILIPPTREAVKYPWLAYTLMIFIRHICCMHLLHKCAS